MTKKTTKPSAKAKATAESAKPAKDAKPAQNAKKKTATAAKPVAAVKLADEAGAAASAKKTAAGTKVAGASEGLQIQLVRSLIGSSPHQRAVVAGLGLRRMNQIVTRKDTREIRGMVAKVPHLVNIIA